VIGENMPYRVIPYAERIGAGYYNPRSSPKFRHNWFRNNRRWIQKQMRDGKEIIDIGPDVARRRVRGASENYEMEQHEILSRGYPFYRWQPQP
jgi:hypothetical protein